MVQFQTSSYRPFVSSPAMSMPMCMRSRVPAVSHHTYIAQCDIFYFMTDTTQSFSFWDTVRQDAERIGYKVDPHAPFISRLLQVRRAMKNKFSFACVFWLRVNQLFVRNKSWRGQHRLRMWRQYRFANDISPYADIGPGLFLPHPVDVTIGGGISIGKNATIYNGVTIVGIGVEHLPRLGDNVTVYTGAKIIKPVQIGDNSVIGALSLCNKDVPPNSTMYGIPPNVTIKPNDSLPTEINPSVR